MLLKNKNIFIVEDNAQNRVVFKMILLVHGAVIEFDRWGEEAIQKLQRFEDPHLIILDLNLAGTLTGFDIYDRIRAIPVFSTVPIVAVSATEPSIGIPKTCAKGFAGFIAKPIDDELFPKQVARVMAGEQVWYSGERVY